MRADILLISAAVLAGCSSPQRIMLSPGHGQESLVRDGSPALVSQKKNLVMLRANNRLVESGSRPAFTLVVRNLSSKSETLLESAITAQQTVSGRSVALRVYRYDELIQ